MTDTNGTGTRTDWAGTWGVMADGRSKVRRRAAAIRKDLLAEYVTDAPLKRRRVEQASRFLALAEQTLESVGTDLKATPRRAAVLERVAAGLLAGLPRHSDPAKTNGSPTVHVHRFGSGA